MDKKYIAKLAEKIADDYEMCGATKTPYGTGLVDGLLIFSQLLKNPNGFKGEDIKKDTILFAAMALLLYKEERRRAKNEKQKPDNDIATAGISR